MRVTSSLLFGTLTIIAAQSARAQSDVERATARDAASTGLAAYQAGHYEQAIDSFSRAEQLVHAPTHLLFLARSQAKLGKLVAAHENYLKVTREALAPGAPKAFTDAQVAAEQERGALDARLPSVTVAVQGGAPSDLSVEMDGTKLPAAMIGIPLPADPGPHIFKASAAAAESAPVTVSLAEGGKETVLLTLRPSSAPSPGAPTAEAATTASNYPLAADQLGSKGQGLRAAGYASLGVGGVGLGLGTYFRLKSGSTRRSADQLFDACNVGSAIGECSPTQRAAVLAKDSDADRQRNLGAASLIVGGVGVAAGVTLLILDARRNHSAAAQASRPHVVPVVGFRSLAVIGTF